jgi:hypothetical protein
MRGAGCARYYLELALEDYYDNPLEAKGRWFGWGASWLRLEGTVDRETLAHLLKG